MFCPKRRSKRETRAPVLRHCVGMKRRRAPRLIGTLGIAGGVALLLGFPAERSHSATPTIKLPGPYPYETPVQVAAPPPVSDSSPLPVPAPFPYSELSSSLSAAQNRDSRAENARHPLTAKAVREAAFKYNGVANFWGFLAILPADVSVYDPELGRTRPVVKGGHVIGKNLGWLRKRNHTATHE